MYASGGALCPVKAFEEHLTFLHPHCNALFQTFDKKTRLFKNEPMGKNTLASMMKKISTRAGLSQTYTNHCVRATTVSNLYKAGVDTKHIFAITKHKDERSLNH